MQTRPSLGRVIAQLLRRYRAHDVARDSAALAYYLLFALFPLVVFLCLLPGVLQIDLSLFLQEAGRVIPNDVVELLQSYIEYVSTQPSRSLLSFSLVFSVYFPWRAAQALLRSVRKAHGLGKPTHFLLYQFQVVLYTLCLLGSIVLSLLLLSSGRRVLSWVAQYLPLPLHWIDLWTPLRFVILAGVVFLALTVLYAMAWGWQDKAPIRHIFPGVAVSMAVWLLSSALFSLYVSQAGNYSVIYGSIGAFMVLLVWLYTSALILIMGAELNDVLAQKPEDRL